MTSGLPRAAVRAAVLLALAGAQAACVADPSIVSAALNGASYLATGKSADSHGLSWLTGEDCDLARTLARTPVCRPEGGGPPGLGLAGADGEPARTALGAVYERAAAGPVSAHDPDPEGMVPPRLYVVAASYREAGDAAAAAVALGGLPARIVRVEVAGEARHRVVVGPLEPRFAPMLEGRLAAAGAERWFQVALCEADLAPPPCIAPPTPRRLAAAER